ncbi:hypothetical protein L0Y40_02020 [Candidatus Wolfebacteria bacterium]|nr:hypothetical protein [Candidatus Wolfebacteria bacterium]
MDILRELFTGPGLNLTLSGLRLLALAAPVWLPLVLGIGFWKVWVGYRRAAFISSMEWVFLEILLPQEITRSPLAMELVLNTFQQSFGEAHAYEKYWKGGVRPWTSLELVSVEGSVHFIIRIHKGSRALIESQIYAEYPDVEIHEVPDYIHGIDFDNELVQLWGAEFALTKADPYPIKTYVDYGLDRDPKEEQKIDPIAPVIEWLGSLGAGEQAWIQILVRQHKDETPKMVGPFRKLVEFKADKKKLSEKIKFFPTTDAWKDAVKKEIEKVVKERKIQSKDEESGPVKLTRMEEEVITALERSITKAAFDVGIRGMYVAEKDKFNPANIGGLIGSFKQYSTNHLNGFKPGKTTGVKAPWQDPFGTRVPRRKRIMLDAYKRRSYFHSPYKRKPFILNTEELATMYHFPGRVSTTPTFKRLEARKAEPPAHLPM